MAEHMADTMEEIVHAAGGVLVGYQRAALDRNGSAIHEHGTCRMGADPKRSALNAFNQMHEVRNVFVVDGSAFTNGNREEPDADDSGVGLAGDGLSRRRDQARQPLGGSSI